MQVIVLKKIRVRFATFFVGVYADVVVINVVVIFSSGCRSFYVLTGRSIQGTVAGVYRLVLVIWL